MENLRPKYCPFCGWNMEPKVYTDSNSELICPIHKNIDLLVIEWADRIKKLREIYKEISIERNNMIKYEDKTYITTSDSSNKLQSLPTKSRKKL